MSSIEKKIIDFFIRYKEIAFLSIITILACVVRFSVRKFESADYEVCLKGWYYYFCDNGGLRGLSQQVGNYPIIYQFFIALMTYIPINELYLYKMISIVFDFILAISVGLLVNHLVGVKVVITSQFCLSYSTVLFLPTVFMNSAVWAQCDVIYTVFVILSIYYLVKDKFNISFVFFGIALAFKIQTIFVLPFILVYYVCTRKFRITKLLISLFSFWIMSLPGFIFGRSLLSPFQWLVGLTGDDKAMQCGLPNLWNIITVDYEYFSTYAIIVSIVILGISLIYILFKKLSFENHTFILYYLAWSVWTCIMFLPGMHERYSYILCMILLVCLIFTKRISVLICFIVEQICIISTYMQFLYSNGLDIRFVSMVYIGLYICFSIMLYNESKKGLPVQV